MIGCGLYLEPARMNKVSRAPAKIGACRKDQLFIPCEEATEPSPNRSNSLNSGEDHAGKSSDLQTITKGRPPGINSRAECAPPNTLKFTLAGRVCLAQKKGSGVI
jgi:hypothetical protein